jgi:Holliday junction DNA helicase RuvA
VIASIRGIVSSISATTLVVDVSGLGYEVIVAPMLAASLHLGDEITLHTSFVVREDSQTLYGFDSAEGRSLFLELQSVTGIGPRVAHSLLAFYGADELRSIIGSGANKDLEKVPGIGKKVASRIILELKDRFITSKDLKKGARANWHAKVSDALQGLGYSTKEADAALDGALATFSESPVESDMSEVLRRALAQQRKS